MKSMTSMTVIYILICIIIWTDIFFIYVHYLDIQSPFNPFTLQIIELVPKEAHKITMKPIKQDHSLNECNQRMIDMKLRYGIVFFCCLRFCASLIFVLWNMIWDDWKKWFVVFFKHIILIIIILFIDHFKPNQSKYSFFYKEYIVFTTNRIRLNRSRRISFK